MSIQKVLDLSVLLIPEEHRLNAGLGTHAYKQLWGSLRVSENGYGLVVFIDPEQEQETMPEWFRPIQEKAVREGCLLVNFDNDSGSESLDDDAPEPSTEPRTEPLFQRIAVLLGAMENCRVKNTPEAREWFLKHQGRLDNLLKQHLPHGSGFDADPKIDMRDGEEGRPEDPDKTYTIVAPFHKMDENGFYCGWIDLYIRVTASLTSEFDLQVTSMDDANGDDNAPCADLCCPVHGDDPLPDTEEDAMCTVDKFTGHDYVAEVYREALSKRVPLLAETPS